MCARVWACSVGSVAKPFASRGAAKRSWLAQLEYSRAEQLLWFGLIAVWRKWPREALFCQELFGRLQMSLPCSHTPPHTHTQGQTLLADLPPSYFHFIFFALLISTPAIGILAVCQTNHEIMIVMLLTLAKWLMLGTQQPKWQKHITARFWSQCTVNQIVSVSDGKGDTNIWTLGPGAWQRLLAAQHVNERPCVTLPERDEPSTSSSLQPEQLEVHWQASQDRVFPAGDPSTLCASERLSDISQA